MFIRRKSGEIRICIDYHGLYKKFVKEAYPLPFLHEVQDCMPGCKIFLKLDLQSGYWQLPVHTNDQEKMAFVQVQEWDCFNLQERCLVSMALQIPFSY